MMISQDTIHICLEVLDQSRVLVSQPDADIVMARLVAARRELLAALNTPAELSLNGAH